MQISSYTTEWHWFSRSGSVLVAIGIYITWRDFVGEAIAIKEQAMKRFDEIEKVIEDNPLSSKMTLESLNVYRQEAKKQFDITRDASVFRICELLFILSGTLIWGFGDLFGKLL